MSASIIYKIVPRDLWQIAEKAGVFTGSPVDIRDGFIHLSTADQVGETAARHCRGEADLLLVSVAADAVDLRWEPSRGGDLFPHLYADLPLTAVVRVTPLPLGPDGRHLFPDLGVRIIRNEYGQPIGVPVDGWTPPAVPSREVMTGRYCTLEPLADRHADGLFSAFSLDSDDREWTYLPYGSFVSRDAFRAWVSDAQRSGDYILFAIHSGEPRRPTGVAGYLRVMPASGSVEVGHLRFSRLLQRTPAATEAMYLMMRRAFELGYRRYEWKCDALNAPSMRAATRLGFTFEGTFRQATVYKGRTRDTAWFSVIDREWPAIRSAFEAWLDPANFDGEGRQVQSLAAIRSGISG